MIDGHHEEHHERLCLGLEPGWVGICHADQTFLDHLIRTHSQWRAVVEFGTYCGVTALILALTMRTRNGFMVTIDNQDGRPQPVRYAWPDNARMMGADLLPADGGVNLEVVEVIHAYAPCLVVMDGGDKPEEVRRYALHVPVGSAFCVHDWGTDSHSDQRDGQICLDDVADVVTPDKFAPLAWKEAEGWKTYFRAWERIA